MTTKAKTGWCCELCGRHLGGEMCENNKGYITCKDENCIGRGIKADLKKNIKEIISLDEEELNYYFGVKG